jgi:hypothetical protein
MPAAPKTFEDAIVFFSDPENSRRYVVSRRWPQGVTCPRCGGMNVAWQPKYNRWQCNARHGRRQFTVKTGTLMLKSPLPLSRWLMAIWLLADWSGISSYEIHRVLKVTQKTAWFMCSRIALGTRGQRREGSTKRIPAPVENPTTIASRRNGPDQFENFDRLATAFLTTPAASLLKDDARSPRRGRKTSPK